MTSVAPSCARTRPMTQPDADAARTMVLVNCIVTGFWALSNIYGSIVVRRLRLKAMKLDPELCSLYLAAHRSLVWCAIKVLALMVAATVLLHRAFVDPTFTAHDIPLTTASESASINFCEEDFAHSPIAEPVNTASSLATYPLLALFGLFGPAAHMAPRHVVSHVALFVVGIGSAALHTFLTRTAQSGDELPMLWWAVIMAFQAFDTTLGAIGSAAHRSVVLVPCFAAGTLVATGVYLGGTSNFLLFFFMFAFSGTCIGIFIPWIVLRHDWEASHGGRGLAVNAYVLLPLAISIGWCMIPACWLWMAELVLCDSMAQKHLGATAFIWTRLVHPGWHSLSAITAWLISQIMVATAAMVQGDGRSVPAIRSMAGVPFVAFIERPTTPSVVGSGAPRSHRSSSPSKRAARSSPAPRSRSPRDPWHRRPHRGQRSHSKT